MNQGKKKQPVKPVTLSTTDTVLKRRDLLKASSLSEAEINDLLHELEISKMELEIQNEELRKARDMAESASLNYSGLFNEIYDFSPAGYFTISTGGTILTLNLSGAFLLKKERDSLINSNFGLFITKETQPVFNNFLNRVFTNSIRQTCDIRLEHKGEPSFYVHLEGKKSENGEKCLLTAIDISEIKNTKLALIEEEKAHRLLIHNLHAGVVVHAPDSGIILANHQASVLLGLSNEQLIGKTGIDKAWSFVYSNGTPVPVTDYPVAQVIATLKPLYNLELGIYHIETGQTVWVRVNAYPEFNDSGNLQQVVVTFIDITSDRRIRKDLLESEQKYRLLHESAGVGIGYFTPDGVLISFNKRAAEYMNGLPEDFAGLSVYTLYPKPEADFYLDRMQKAAVSVNPMEYDDQVTLPNDVKWFHSVYNRILDANGNVVGIQIISTDVTKQKWNEESLRFNQFAVDHMSDAAFYTRADGSFLYANEAACTLLGYTKDEMLEMSVNDIDKTENGFNWSKHFRELKQQGKLTFEGMHVSKSGEYIPVEIHANYVTFGGKEYNCAFVSDIRNRRKAESDLRAEELRMRAITECAQDAILLMDPEGKISFLNPATERIFGYPASELIGKNLHDILAPERFHAAHARAFPEYLQSGKGKSVNKIVELEGKHKLGHEIPVELSLSGLELHDGRYTVGIIRDISERRQAQKKINESEANARAIMESTDDVIVLLDKHGIVIDSNESHAQRVGLSREALLGRNIFELLPPHIAKSRQKIVNQVFKTGKPVHSMDFNHDRWSEYVIFPVADEHGLTNRVAVFSRNVTERIQAEEKLHTAAARLKRAELATLSGNWEMHLDTNLLVVSEGAQKVYGIYEDETDFENIKPIPLPEYRLGLDMAMHELITENKPFDRVYKIITADTGEVKDIHSIAFYDSEKRIVFGVIRDITEQIRTEAALTESIKTYRTLVEKIPDGVYKSTHDGKFLNVNPAMVKMLGYESSQELMAIDINKDLYFDESDRESLTLEDMRNDLEVFRLRKKDGSEVWVEDNGWYTFDSMGNTLYHEGVLRDVTARKLAEEELRETKDYLDKLLTYANSPIIVWDSKFRITKFNKAFERLTGLQAADVLNLTVDILFPESSRDRSLGYIRQATSGNRLEGVEIDITDSNGILHTLLWNSANIYAPDGKTSIATIAQAQDITQRIAALNLLKESEELWHKIIDTSPDGIAITTLDGTIAKVSQKGIQMWGYDNDDEIINRSLLDFIAETDHHKAKSLIGLMLEGQYTGPAEYHMLRKDGSIFYAEANAEIIRDANDEPKNILIISRDITDRKHAEEEVNRLNAELEQRVLDRTAQLEAANKDLEAFSYSVSHDLRTPLRALDGFANILMEDYADTIDDEGKRMLKIIVSNANNMGLLIDELLSFSRLGRREISYSVINMREMALMVYQENTTDAEKDSITFSITDIPDASGDPAMIRQVWVNLISNAVKFTSKKQQRSIEIGFIPGNAENVYFIKDNGAGFDMANVKNMFGVFKRLHTTREFEGTGVGLAIVKRIVQRHKGKIMAEGEVNKGATVSFSIPLHR